jgi:hypothetical protein
MSDPRRWREDPSGATDILLRGARRPQPPDARDLQRLGAAVDAIARGPVRRQAPWFRLAVAGAFAFAIVGAGTFVWALHARDVKRRAALAAAEEKAEGMTQRLLARAPRADDGSTASPSVEPAPVRPTPARPRRHVAEPKVAVVAPAAPVAVETAKPTDSLAREVPLIDEGRADLATAPSRALAVLETHRREFPHGQLAAEREFLAVQALLQMNRRIDAKKRAVDLGVHYPSSSYAARAARLIEDADAQRAAVPAKDGSRGSAPSGLRRVQDRL